MRGPTPALAALAVVVALAAAPVVSVHAQEPEVPAEASDTLESARRDLEELRFEKALSSIEAFLARPGLTDDERVAALILRSQAHVAYGDLDAAESDYGALLALRPAYAPEASLTPPKAMARYDRVRDRTIGSVRVNVVPPDARVFLDDQEIVAGPEGEFPALAGDRGLRAERSGFDALEMPVEIKAGETVSVELRLVPNSRTLVFRTDPEGVSIALDGVEIGVTETPETSEPGARPMARLVVENVALGEHTFRLSKACYRSVVLQDIVTVDLDDFSPKVFRPVSLEAVRSRLTVRGGPPGAEVLVAGRPVGRMPLEEVPVCPGDDPVVVRRDDRTLWSSVESLPPDGERVVEITPRPNVVLVGETDWPAGLERLADITNVLDVRTEGADEALTKPEGWQRIWLPEDTDLAVAVLPPAQDGSSDRWIAYGPWTRTVTRIDGVDLRLDRPRWSVASAGLRMADSRVGGTARVVDVVPGGPAAAAGLVPGDRIVAIGTAEVADAAEARALVAASPPGATLEIRVESISGEERAVEVRTAESPRVLNATERAGASAPWLAAWAAVDGASATPLTRSTALANYALFLSDAGRHRAALEAWRRVRWGGRPGLGDGTAAYYTGRELLRLSREDDAEAVFRQASLTAATAFSDEGPEVGPAAADHLADLGVETGSR